MLNNAESVIQKTTGSFSTIPQLFNQGEKDSYSGVFKLPGQCRVFLGSNYEFIWFIEQWDVTDGLLINKKIYPAKVTGINLPYLFNETVTWRDGLIQSNTADTTLAFRPGFGQAILSDLSRPFKSVAMQQNHLGLNIPLSDSFYLCGTLGRLMSVASYVDPELAAKYDANQSKKKKKSLNSQDYEQIPTYPDYDISIYNSGY